MSSFGEQFIAAMLESGSIDSLRKIQSDLFYEDELKIFDFVKQHYRNYAVLPSFQTVEKHLQTVLPQAEETVDYYRKRLVDRKLHSLIRDKFSNFRELMKKGDLDSVRSLIKQMESYCRIHKVDEDIRNVDEVLHSVLRDYDVAHESPGVTGIPSGWKYLDDKTGGWQNGDLVSFVARTELGKTYALLQQAVHNWDIGYSVLLITMEMTLNQTGRRILGMKAGVNPQYIKTGTLSTWAHRRIKHCADNILATDKFRIYAGSFSKKTDDVDTLVHEFKPDIVYIDSAYRLKAEQKKYIQSNERIADVVGGIKIMTITHNRPFVVTTQFGRSAGKQGKSGSLENIAYSDAWGTDSSVVVAIKDGKPPNQRERRTLEILKGREGEKGEFEINYTFSPINFKEVIESKEDRQEATDIMDWVIE